MKKLKITALAAITALTFGTIAYAADSKAPEKTAEPAAETKAKPVKPAAKAKLVDINSATEEQLKAIPGVEDESAKKIIAGRPYKNKSELKTKKIIPDELYQKISKLIKAVC